MPPGVVQEVDIMSESCLMRFKRWSFHNTRKCTLL